MEAHDAELRVQRAGGGAEDAWRRRVDQRALALDPPGWLLAELGPVPTDPQERAVWRRPPRNWTATGAPTASITTGPAKHGWGRVARDGRAAAPATPLTDGRAEWDSRAAGRRGRGERTHTGRLGRRREGAEERHQLDRAGCWAPNHAATPLAAAATGTAAWAALERLADHHRHRDDRHHPTASAPADSWPRLGRSERDGR